MLNIKNMSKKKQYLYNGMWGNKNFDFPVSETKVSAESTSCNSYSFEGASTVSEEICCNRIMELFGIVDKELFRKKFSQSCGGDGQELKRISTLHSSSLCALLFFYDVTDNHPLKMSVNGRECEFTYSRFEYQNTVIRGRKPSNMDIVLVGKDCESGRPVILFLESKFSEYMDRVGKKLNIANEYLTNKYSTNIYRVELEKLDMSIKENATEKEFALECSEVCYLEGIKQMISHFIGVNNFMKETPVTVDQTIDLIRENADVYLGEILFDTVIGDYEIKKGVTCYQSYKENYEKLVDILNAMDSSVNVVKTLFSYEMFKKNDFIKEDKIKQFYFECGLEK